uniref:Capsid protein n=1 Tax=Ascaris lumbricoides TaxID=6252 RepID=A0A0M3IRU9_ASCLU
HIQPFQFHRQNFRGKQAPDFIYHPVSLTNINN